MIFPLVCRSFQTSIILFALAIPSVLVAQTSIETASVTLPETPQPQGDLAQVNDTSSQTSSSVQSTEQAVTPPTPHPLTAAEKKAASEAELQRELHQRLAGVVPNFNAVLDGSTTPLSSGQKMRASFRAAIDPYQITLAAITGAFGQATDTHSTIDPDGFHHGYQQGMIGYGKRFGAGFIDQFDGTILGNGVFPVLLHQDARYYRMGTGSFKKRFLYSIGTTIYCKGDNGKWQPNVSNMLGNIASGGISNLYYPAADRGFDLTMEQALTVTAEGAFGALLIEFYPDIRQHFRKKNTAADPTIQNSTPTVATAAPNQAP